MPFNVKSILKTLKEEIETSDLNKDEREVLSFYLRKNWMIQLCDHLCGIMKKFLVLSKQKIAREDYSNLGIFYDENLNQFTSAQMKKD